MPIRRLKQLQTPELKNNSELYRMPTLVHTAPYILIPLECHIYIPLTIEQWIYKQTGRRSVPSPRPGPRRLIIYLPVPSSAVTLSRRPVVDMIWQPAAGWMLRPVPSLSRLFLDRPHNTHI